jgi:hypothetical protein
MSMSITSPLSLRARAFRSSALALALSLGAFARAQCPELGPVQVYTGAGTTTCPCFVVDEEAGTVFTNIPAAQFPIEITKIGIGWGSVGGGQPQSLEDSINIYNAGLPNPGTPIFTLPGPVLSDGFINEYDIASQWPGLGPVIVTSPTFTVTLRFANTNNVPPYPPSMVHDGNGCTTGRNAIKVSGIGWFSGCALGVSGDWLVYVKYKPFCAPSMPGTPFCFGDGTFADHTSPCACGNNGGAGNGCAHSFDPNGANLSATGDIALDTVVLHSQFEPVSSFTLFMQHSTSGDAVFHDGTLCAAGSLIRLRGRAAVGGEAFFPNSNFAQDSTTSLSQRGGVFPGLGVRRYYAGWYRNASTTFCPPATANVTNGWYIDW